MESYGVYVGGSGILSKPPEDIILSKIQERGLQARRNAQKLIRDMENGYQIIE